MRAMLQMFGLVHLALAVSLSVAAADTSPHKSAFVEANGVKLHYLEWSGSGKQGVLLMLAGLGNDAHVFDGFAVRFTDRYRVLALTRRGWGESGKPRTGYDVKTRAEDLRRFLDALGIARVTLIGHSIAGDELTAFASQYPARADKVVYLDAAYDRSKTEALLSDDPALTFLPNRGQPPGNDAIRAQLMKGSSAFHPDYRGIRAPALAFYAAPRQHPAFRKAPTAADLKRMNACGRRKASRTFARTSSSSAARPVAARPSKCPTPTTSSSSGAPRTRSCGACGRSSRGRDEQPGTCRSDHSQGLIDVGQFEAVCDQGTEVQSAAAHHLDETAHALFAAWAERRHDAVVAESGGERVVWHLQFARVHAERRQRAAWAEHAQSVLEGLLSTEGFDGHVDPGTGEAADLLDDVHLAVIEDDVDAHLQGHRDAIVIPATPITTAAPISFAFERISSLERAI
jgi:pimeloyl-ACP methyl ester carboxylesterase